MSSSAEKLDGTPSKAGKAGKAGKASKSKVVRKQTRPLGEFCGNWGCFFWTFYIPLQIWYFYGMNVMGRGELLVPNAKFWYDLTFTLPEGIAIRPTWEAMGMIGIWILSQAVCELFLPSEWPFGMFGVREGVTLKNGRRLRYQMNGMLAFVLTHFGFFALCYLGLLDPTYIWHQMGALLTGGVIVAFVFALWMYVDFGLCWERHVDDPEFEEDWGVFQVKDFWNDFFMGVARNPRIFHRWFDVPLDLKRWWDGRTLTLWVILNMSYIAAQYYSCKFFFDFAPDSLVESRTLVAPQCDMETGSWANVGLASWFITIAHWYYVFDYNLCEPAYLTTTDIRHDLFGYMLTYGMFGFLCWYYPFAFLGFLSAQGAHPSGWIVTNHVPTAIGVLMYLFGMFMFRYTNIQKHNFRTFIADLKSEGKSDKEIDKALGGYLIWGKPVDYIRTQEGSYLLCSGTWGLARHFNYIGDLTMCVGWAVSCYSPDHAFPWVPFSYCAYFWVMDIHRAFRDEERCFIKYGRDWENFCKKVQYRILPGVF